MIGDVSGTALVEQQSAIEMGGGEERAQLQKQNKADDVAEPDQVQLQFAQSQPEVAFGAQKG